MATTRIISMHVNQGKTIAQCLTDRTEYAKNPEKTKGGELISCYACDPHTADAEFLLFKQRYAILTGRRQKNDVIAYQVRQSFKPGEITPEEANKVGYEFASRFLKGKHAFIVATHVDKRHIHNHIIWNSTTLDCTHKFRDFRGSGKAVARLSDMICMEHSLSVVQNPRLGNNSYNKWLGNRAKPSHRDLLCKAIDEALAKKPDSFEALLKPLEAEGYSIRRGANITFCMTGQKNIRLRSLGEAYSEAALRAVIAGQRHHTPRKKRAAAVKEKQKPSLLIDIQAKLDEGKGVGYQRWASVFNLKQMAQTVLYLQEHSFADYEELASKADSLTEQVKELRDTIKRSEQRMSEVQVLKTHIINYAKTRETFAAYRKSGYAKSFLEEHEPEILLHRAAKRHFNELGLKKLPTVKNLQTEYAELLAAKKEAYAQLHALRDEQRELLIHRANIEQILGIQKEQRDKEQERKEPAEMKHE